MLGQVDKLSVQMNKEFYFMASRKKLCRRFISTLPSAYTMSYLFVEKLDPRGGEKKTIKIRVAVLVSIDLPKTT